MNYELHLGDCLEVMPTLPANSIDSIVCDPPYGLSFMGRAWDHGVPGAPFWEAALRVAKPGAMLLAFGGTRTHHRLMVAIEDAGWEIRDCLMWLYGSGFPKSMDISKAIDKAAGAEREVIGQGQYASRKPHQYKGGNSLQISQNDPRIGHPLTNPATDSAAQWQGYGTALKPAWEPIIMAMKPLDGTFANNALVHGVAGINVDGCRIPGLAEKPGGKIRSIRHFNGSEIPVADTDAPEPHPLGRWPANLILDEEAAALLDKQTGTLTSGTGAIKGASGKGYQSNAFGRESRPAGTPNVEHGDTGGASRFFYCAKASRFDRGEGNNHPCVKPVTLMRWLVRLVTPHGGTVLDPFLGSGSTLKAAALEGFSGVGIELDADYLEIARRRIELAQARNERDQPMLFQITN